jgi:hypothetical protein
MGKKICDAKMAKKLAILITEKIGRNDKVEVVASRVLDDYFAATKIVREYGQALISKKKLDKNRQVKIAKWAEEDKQQALKSH